MMGLCLITVIMFSGHYNDLSYDNIELSEILGSRKEPRGERSVLDRELENLAAREPRFERQLTGRSALIHVQDKESSFLSWRRHWVKSSLVTLIAELSLDNIVLVQPLQSCPGKVTFLDVIRFDMLDSVESNTICNEILLSAKRRIKMEAKS